jgi:hypothetical protein
MASLRVEILTPWQEVVDEEGDISRWPLVTQEFSIQRWSDITGQDATRIVPSPNLLAILAEADETVIRLIEADDRFRVIWEDFT